MPSKDKTPLGLNLWGGSDRPKRDDFNVDNEKIDMACRTVLSGLSEHLEGGGHLNQGQRQKWDGAAAHTGEGIAGREGIHGLRYLEGVLEVNVGGVWQPCGTGQPAVDYRVYGVCVDTDNTDPEGAVTYTDDAVGLTPGGGEWDGTFFGNIRPCLLKNGAVSAYLNPDNYLEDAQGGAADIFSGEAGDVMVEIPRLAYAIYREGRSLFVKVTDHPDAVRLDSRFCYAGHTRAAAGDRQKLYVGAYLGYEAGGRLRSLSGKQIGTGHTLAEFRGLAQAGGGGYDLLSFYPFMLLQCLCLIRFKDRDTQAALGWGNTMGRAPIATGTTDTKGMFFGEATGRLQMKAFGIEDLWGNLACFLDGVRVGDSGSFLVATNSLALEEAWRDTGRQCMETMGYILQVHGDNELGFLAQEIGAGATTGWAAYGGAGAGLLSLVGGHHSSRQQSGAFQHTITTVQDFSTPGITGRLMYL